MGQDVPDGSGGLPPTVVGGLGPGSRVAGYRLEEQIGRGGMAVVYRARDERLGRLVALKVLAPELAGDAGFRQRFLHESRVAAAVDDPHVIPVFEAGEAGGVLFIAMRLVRGGDVQSLLAAQRPLEPGRACGMVSAVASALDAAHADGLVHRDVKPANMLLDARPGRPDHVYLSDFGISRQLLATSRLTRTDQFLGTLPYAAPEQFSGGEVGGRADQYALACVAFELLSGSPPFLRDTFEQYMYAHLSAPPPTLTERRPGLPPAVDEVFAKVLAKSPADRFGSCGEFAGALRSALDVPASPPTPRPPRRRRGIWVAAASGAAVVIAAVVAAVLLLRPGPAKVEALSAIVKPMASECRPTHPPGLAGVTAATRCAVTIVGNVTVWGYQYDSAPDYRQGFDYWNSYIGWRTPPKGGRCPASAARPVGEESWYSPKYSVHPGQILECIVQGNAQEYVLTMPTQRTILIAESSNSQDLAKWFTETNPG